MASRYGAAPPQRGRHRRLSQSPPRGRERRSLLRDEANYTESAKSTAPEIGERIEFECPVCRGGNADATYRVDRATGRPEWFLGCFTASCRARGGTYLDDLGEALGLGRGATKAELVVALRRRCGGRAARAAREELPSEARLAGWHDRLRADRPALRYLTRECGLTLATIERCGLGYGEYDGRPAAFLFPVCDAAGKLLTLKERYWPEPWRRRGKSVWKRALAGHRAALYPAVPNRRAVMLCAGELDALVALQHGLPAVTATTGAVLPESLAPELAGRRVAVVYDVGEDAAAVRSVSLLNAAGAEAWVVSLGLPEKGDDLGDWFVKYGRTAKQLRERMNRARRSR